MSKNRYSLHTLGHLKLIKSRRNRNRMLAIMIHLQMGKKASAVSQSKLAVSALLSSSTFCDLTQLLLPFIIELKLKNSTLKDGSGKDLLDESKIFTGKYLLYYEFQLISTHF